MPKLKNTFLKPTKDLYNLQLLEEISKDSFVSQRKLSHNLGVALGVTNLCLKKMINKGLVKVRGINHKRISYYLTSKGLSEKTQLTYRFLQHTISYYVNLKRNIAAQFNLLSKSNLRRIVFYGAGEVMEVAYIVLHDTPLELIGIVDDDPKKQGKKMFGFDVQFPEIIKELNPDAIVLTSIKYRKEILRNLKKDESLKKIKLCSI